MRSRRHKRSRSSLRLPLRVQPPQVSLATLNLPTMLDFLIPALLGLLRAVAGPGGSCNGTPSSTRSAQRRTCAYIDSPLYKYIDYICGIILVQINAVCFYSFFYLYPLISNIFWSYRCNCKYSYTCYSSSAKSIFKFYEINVYLIFNFFESLNFCIFNFLGIFNFFGPLWRKEARAPPVRHRALSGSRVCDGMACWFAPGFSLLSLRGGGPPGVGTPSEADERNGAGVFDSDEDGEGLPPPAARAPRDVVGAAARLVLPWVADPRALRCAGRASAAVPLTRMQQLLLSCPALDLHLLRSQMESHEGLLETGDLRHYFKWHRRSPSVKWPEFRAVALALHRDVQARRVVHTTLPDLYEADWVDLSTQQAAGALDAPGGPSGVRRSARLQAAARAPARGAVSARAPVGRRARVAGRVSTSRRGRASAVPADAPAPAPEPTPSAAASPVLASPVGVSAGVGSEPSELEVRLAQLRDSAIVYENNPAQSSADACGGIAVTDTTCDGAIAAVESPRGSRPFQEWPAWALDTTQGAIELCVQGRWYPGRWEPAPDAKWWRTWTAAHGSSYVLCFLYRWRNGKEYREGFPLSRVRRVSVVPPAVTDYCAAATFERDLYRTYCERSAALRDRSRVLEKAEDAWLEQRRTSSTHPSVPKPAVLNAISGRPRRESRDAKFDCLRVVQWNCRGSGGTQKIAAILHTAEVREADVIVLNEIHESVSAFRIRLQSVLSDFSIVGTGRVHKGGGGTAILARRHGCVRWSGGRPDREGEAASLRGHVGSHAFTIIGAYVTPNRALADTRAQAKCDTLRSQTFASIARATENAQRRGDAVLLVGDLNAGFKADQIHQLDGPFATERVAHNFTTPVSSDEFSVVRSWGLFLRSGLWGTEACAAHTPSGHLLDQVWASTALRTTRLEQLPVPAFTAPHPSAGKPMSDHAPIFVTWSPFPTISCTPTANPPSQPRVRYSEWDIDDKARYNWLVAQGLRSMNNAEELTRCGETFVASAQTVEAERIAATQKKKRSTFWTEELIQARKLTRKLRRADRSSQERRAASKTLRVLIAKRSAELAATTALSWAEGLRHDSKGKWKEIRTQKILHTSGLVPRVSAVKVGSLTSKVGNTVIDQDAATEIARYAVRLNAQSWEVQGLTYDLDFARVYRALLGWRGVLLDRHAESPEFCETQLALGNPLPQLCMEDISTAEVDIATRRLKSGKGAGADATTNEQLINLDIMGRYAVTRLFAALFQSFSFLTFFVAAMPAAWLVSLVQFLPKSSTLDPLDLKQQRGIRLLSCFGKLFRQVLARRLRIVTASMLRDSQALKYNEGCTTNALVLTQKVGERLERGYATYAVFIDLVKAFDTVNRRLLWARYRSYGICGRLFWALRAGYPEKPPSDSGEIDDSHARRAGAPASVLKGRIGPFVSECFRDEGSGVRQGDVDSSDAFTLFIDDLDAEIQREEERVGRKLGVPLVGCNDLATGDRINALKHADDTVVVAASAEDAQLLLNAVTRWCCKWQIAPNAVKCKVVIFHPAHLPRPTLSAPLSLIGTGLEVVESVVYLGFLLHECGIWTPHVERRIGLARDWDRIATQLLGHHGGATVGVAADVRSATAEVGSLYGAEFWGTSSDSPAQRAVDSEQAKIARGVLGVRPSAEAAGVLTELGWTATSTLAWQQRLLFWWRLGRSRNQLLQTLEWQASECTQDLDRCSEFNWFRITSREVQQLSKETGLTAAALRALPRKDFRKIIVGVGFAREYRQRSAVFAKSRLVSFGSEIATRKLRSADRSSWRTLRAPYLDHVSSRYHVRLLAMTRLGILPIEEERGRWNSIPREERWCTHCPGVLGTTRHFLRECTPITADIVPPWLSCDSGVAAGAWWRRTARLLELRWREKCAILREAPECLEYLVDVSAGFEVDTLALSVAKPRFLEPGSSPPPDLACEIFTDGSKRLECSRAGWGVWAAFLDAATGMPTGTLEAEGPVDTLETESGRIEPEHTNMTGELWGLMVAFREIQTLAPGSVVLVRFDCIPAVMLAVGSYRPHRNAELVHAVHQLYLDIRSKYNVYFMHAKGHSGIFGNTRADALADTGAELDVPVYRYLTPSELGGAVRISERYVCADCGAEADLERKYAGKRRARKTRTAQGVENGHTRAIRNHLRHLGIQGTQAAAILANIVEPWHAPGADAGRAARSDAASVS